MSEWGNLNGQWGYYEKVPSGGGGDGGGGEPPGSGCLNCLGCLGMLVALVVIGIAAVYLGGIISALGGVIATLQIIIMLVTMGLAIRVLIYTILNIKEGLSMNFLEFGDFLPLIAGIGVGLIVYFFLTPHNIDIAFCLGVIIANGLVRR